MANIVDKNRKPEMTTVIMRETVLEAVRFGLRKEFGSHMAQQMTLETIRQFAGEVVYDFETSILGQHNKQKYTIDFEAPLNWWQHLKLEKLPDWFKKKYPVKYKTHQRTVEFDHVALMPDLSHVANRGLVTMHTIAPFEDGLREGN
jgi:hypothetical protein